MSEKKIIFSGAQPSGKMTLGNYLGAIQNWTKLQDEYDCFYSVVDLHAITVPQEAKNLRANTMQLLAQYLACGLDPEKNTIFIQSHVSAHAELMWILNTMTYMGELSRMTQFKDKSQKSEANLNAGLFTYPVLMAADILLYDAEIVPVGADQRQHIEKTRDFGERFNNIYGNTFKLPEYQIPKIGAKIMNLQDPSVKMSKSAPKDDKGTIFMLDDIEITRKKIMSACTDSEGKVYYDEDGKPGISNLISLVCVVNNMTIEEANEKYKDYNYKDFKIEVADSVCKFIKGIQDKFYQYRNDEKHLKEILTNGANKARVYASKKMEIVKEKVGLSI